MITTLERPVELPVEVIEHNDSFERYPYELVVVVSHEDIRNGEPHSADNYAIALAAKRAYPGYDFQMGISELHRNWEFGYARYANPEASRWAIAFDRNKNNVTPERFIFKRV